jgi:hypothetical protein
VRSGSAVHRGAFTSDQPGLTARVACTGQSTSRGQTGLIP